MSGSNARSNAIRAITSYKPDLAPLNYADTKPTEIYGSNVFSDKVMKERLPRIVYKSLRKTIEQGVQLDPSLADIVASTMKDWAIEKGATHFTHVFYPLTGHFLAAVHGDDAQRRDRPHREFLGRLDVLVHA